MMYAPQVQSMNRVAGAPLGTAHSVLLFDNIKSAGAIQYAFLLGVFENATKQPVYFIASEVNTTAATLGGGSHFLGIFNGQGHANLGASDDWGDPKKFFPKALSLAQERFAPEQPEA
ncbi:MAG: hypothetical protein JWO87_458 [Phycisphaerales bacterium]|nr:hypothetical protein [Phycisphaerales bacterium]